MATYRVKRGDTGSATPSTVLLDGNGNPVDLTDADVRFLMRKDGADAAKVAAAADVIGDATAGAVQYVWAEADLDSPGIYRAEYEVSRDDSKETFPSDGWITVEVLPDLDDPAEESP